jgi:hypothetical protein
LSCAFLILLDYDKIVAMEGESQNIGWNSTTSDTPNIPLVKLKNLLGPHTTSVFIDHNHPYNNNNNNNNNN